MKEFIIYTDGGSRGNPGSAGAGWVIMDGDENEVSKNSKFLGTQTNNWAEYEAVILALGDLKRRIGSEKLKDAQIMVKLDSQLVARQLSGEYKIKEESLFGQFIKIHNMRVKDIPHITFTHVPREENNVADGLANEAMDNGTNTLL